ncbi:MAG: hypothetical protein HQ567_26595 [Candidatus Nealsonbacteria bacterium]|nr:hypothetical protein [Candidatus Nealsonbacteria bacterium]
MRVRPMLIVLAAAAGSLAVAAEASAAGRVQLELVGDGRGASLLFQEWGKALSKAGIRNVRIRSSKPSDKVGIAVRGTADSPLYVVTGVIRSRDELLLPSGRFRRSDAARLARWLDDLARHGPEDRRPAKTAFGLSSEQLIQVQADLARPVGFSTKDVTRDAVVAKIARQLTVPLRIDAASTAALREDNVGEELLSLSCGTSLAYVLRPMGLCLVPRAAGGRVQLDVVRAQPDLKIWPVGWESDKSRRDVAPALFEFHNVNIQGVSAAVALEAIGKRLKLPVLIDHNALARHGIKPAKLPVSHPASRTTYSLALRKLLFQAGLKSEVRVDEADQPFLWVTTVKPV